MYICATGRRCRVVATCRRRLRRRLRRLTTAVGAVSALKSEGWSAAGLQWEQRLTVWWLSEVRCSAMSYCDGSQ